MTAECSSTADAITGVLLAGDAVLNLTQQPLNTIAGTSYLTAHQDAFSVSRTPAHVEWNSRLLPALVQFQKTGINRIVVVSEENCSDAAVLTRELNSKGIPHLHCSLVDACESDAFMDEEDAEAVTERLRQLGYI